MLMRPFALLLTAGIAASFFLAWFTSPVGEVLVPYEMLTRNGTPDLAKLPPELLWFLGSFGLAAALTVLGLLGWFPKLMGLIIGAYPFAMVGYAAYRAKDAGSQLFGGRISISSVDDLQMLFGQFRQFAGPGMWLYFGCALVLLILAIFDPGKRAAV